MSRVVTGMSGTGVEIGAMDGFSSAVILASSKLLLTSIDPFVRDSMDGTLIGSEARFRRNVGPWVSRSTLVRDYSHHVAGTWSSRIDFLFIDGDHNYAAVKRDYLDWTPWLREGGVLAMHDSRAYRGGLWHWPAPSAVAEEEIFSRPGHWDVIGEACSLTVARRT